MILSQFIAYVFISLVGGLLVFAISGFSTAIIVSSFMPESEHGRMPTNELFFGFIIGLIFGLITAVKIYKKLRRKYG